MRRVRLVRREQVDLGLMVHRVPQVQARAELQVARLETAFEQQNRPTPAERAHPLGLGQVEQCKPIGSLQPWVNPLDAVAVSIRLHHRPDLGVGRGAVRTLQVVRQGIGVDQGFDRARHLRILPATPLTQGQRRPGAR